MRKDIFCITDVNYVHVSSLIVRQFSHLIDVYEKTLSYKTNVSIVLLLAAVKYVASVGDHHPDVPFPLSL